MASEFSGRTALVTGASRGIGAATALALAKAGASRVILHYHLFEQGALDIAHAVRAAGADASIFSADLATLEGIRALIAALPPTDILINNAGSLVKRARLAEMTEPLFDQVLNLNFRSAYLLAQAVAPGMIERGGGVIVNLSSIAARNGGGVGAAVYAAAKAAVMTMTKGLARELAPRGIRVNAVSPGTVDNYFHEQFSTREMLDNVIAATPAGRLATNDDVAGVILFLCSDQARYIHGQTLEVNGGMLAP
jgi:NAD(P)-dependent dehydrogenase (short-subunit alcohol dehydrogenase family)